MATPYSAQICPGLTDLAPASGEELVLRSRGVRGAMLWGGARPFRPPAAIRAEQLPPAPRPDRLQPDVPPTAGGARVSVSAQTLRGLRLIRGHLSGGHRVGVKSSSSRPG